MTLGRAGETRDEEDRKLHDTDEIWVSYDIRKGWGSYVAADNLVAVA